MKLLPTFFYQAGCIIIAAAIYLEPAKATAQPYTLTRFERSFVALGMRSRDVIYGTKEDFPALIDITTGKAQQAGTFQYEPRQASLEGDLVGYQVITDDNDKNDAYYFYTERGQESSLLLSDALDGYSETSIAMNDAHVIAIPQKKAIKFFAKTTPISTVTLPEGIEYNGGGGTTVLSGGDVLVRLVQFGTARWARIASSGTIAMIPESILSINVSPLVALSDNLVRYSVGNEIYRADLLQPPVRISTVTTTTGVQPHFAYVNSSGTAVGWVESLVVPGDSEQRNIIIGADGRYVEPSCIFPNAQRFTVGSFIQIADDGTILAQLVDRHSSDRLQGVLLPTRDIESGPNYCVQTSAKVVGACAKYFSRTLELKKSIPDGKQCELLVKVRSLSGRPLANLKVGKQQYFDSPIYTKGKTNRRGEFLLKFTAPDDFRVVAPTGSRILRSNILSINTY